MAKGSPALTRARREEIVGACAKLYETMSFKDITIKEIAAFTSFTRPSIYNYFQTKEEIFLALLQQEYEAWREDLDALRPEGGGAPEAEFAEGISRTLARRERMLKLLSMNLNDMEENSRLEALTAFKAAYGSAAHALRGCLARFCPELGEQARREFLAAYLPLVYGIYPYAAVTDKQKAAMERAGVAFEARSIYDISYLGAKKLLGV